MSTLRLALNDDGAPEIFRSLQGEGPMAGRVRTFVRLSGCNLHCVWCDTAYTWNWIGTPFAHEKGIKFDPAEEMAKAGVEETAALIAALPAEGLVITGGEPLMQSSALIELIDAVKARQPALRIEIETNGSIVPSPELAARVDLFCVSPKLAHSGNEPGIALKPDALGAFAALPQAVFKFVVQERADIAEAAVLVQAHNIAPGRVYIMPEGTDAATLSARARDLADAVLERGYNFTDRLHIHLFGQARGV